MQPLSIAILEDDRILVNTYRGVLEAAGHRLTVAGTIAEFEQQIGREAVDIVILDWRLPDGTADRVLKTLRVGLGWSVPILVVSASDEEAVIVEALWLGADDFVVKPVDLRQLLDRLDAHVLRGGDAGAAAAEHHFGAYRLVPSLLQVGVGEQVVALAPAAFAMADALFRSNGRLLSRVQLHNRAANAAPRSVLSVDAAVADLRHALQLDGRHGWNLVSVLGYGYRMERGAGLHA